MTEKQLEVHLIELVLDLRYLTHRWQKAIEDVLIRVRDHMNAMTAS